MMRVMRYDYDEGNEEWRVVIRRVNEMENDNIRFIRDWNKGTIWSENVNSDVSIFMDDHIRRKVNRGVNFYSSLSWGLVCRWQERFSGVSGFDRYLVTEGVLNEL